MLWKHITCFSVVFSGKSPREKTTNYGEMQTFNGYSLGEVTVECATTTNLEEMGLPFSSALCTRSYPSWTATGILKCHPFPCQGHFLPPKPNGH